MKKPIIGITPLYNYSEPQMTRIKMWMNNSYFDAIEDAGGIPVMLPWQNNDTDIARALEIVDGVILPGGSDISPLYFGEVVLEQCEDILPSRDEAEILLTKYAYEKDVPLLGICRGCQVINVAMGGTLYQDIPSQLNREDGVKIIHSPKNIPAEYPSHRVNFSKDSRLYECFGQDEIFVNSLHHQAAKEIAPAFFASAHAEDGITEAVESISKDRFFLGVQWHPETMFKNDENSRRLFRYFIDYASSKM